VPEAKPKDRRGADVDEINRRTAYEPRNVDWTGTIGPYTYRAWRVTDPCLSPFVRAVVMKDGKPVRAARHVGPATSSVFHEQPSHEALRRFLLGKVRRRRVPQTGSIPSHPCWKKRLQRRREQRERWREPEVETEHYGGGTHHRIK